MKAPELSDQRRLCRTHRCALTDFLPRGRNKSLTERRGPQTPGSGSLRLHLSGNVSQSGFGQRSTGGLCLFPPRAAPPALRSLTEVQAEALLLKKDSEKNNPPF